VGRWLPALARAECTRQLGHREDTSPVVLGNLFLAHATDQAEVVLCHSFVMATLAKFAVLAVAIEDQRRRQAFLDVPHVLEPPPKPSVVRMERDLPGVTVLAMPQDAVTRHPPLERSKDDAAQF
jgi:hypothetical protein